MHDKGQIQGRTNIIAKIVMIIIMMIMVMIMVMTDDGDNRDHGGDHHHEGYKVDNVEDECCNK